MAASKTKCNAQRVSPEGLHTTSRHRGPPHPSRCHGGHYARCVKARSLPLVMLTLTATASAQTLTPIPEMKNFQPLTGKWLLQDEVRRTASACCCS